MPYDTMHDSLSHSDKCSHREIAKACMFVSAVLQNLCDHCLHLHHLSRCRRWWNILGTDGFLESLVCNMTRCVSSGT